MANRIDIKVNSTLADIEKAILSLQSPASAAKQRFVARISSDLSSSYFKDIWSAIAVAAGVATGLPARVTAWGLQDWSGQNDEDAFALSHPGITAVQLGAEVLTDTKSLLNPAAIRRHISSSGGVLGSGGRRRTVVELDPELPKATPLVGGSDGRDTFFEFARDILRNLEIGALARKRTNVPGESAAKGTILEFLYELQSNAVEHGRASRNVRLLRLQKHLYPNRKRALDHSVGFAELSDYLIAQPDRPSNRMFNLVEASVSDFGPGIIDGFLATFIGRGYRQRSRSELLADLLHQQLSCKSDPSAGLGIGQALAAAMEMGAFVSLRTAEFWLVMGGDREGQPRMLFRDGAFARIPGTHWQLLLPDPTNLGAVDGPRA